ncbi:WD40 repeat domain-containing protein [Sporomusa sphaeroides]|uniref:WD40 repeat domain-containing protein n=1 Tax=Sporomusa sphaeroides TaxID=47679 RepID=UPI002B620D28|nr:hypothetical protein [Sporomusa sphaeroides]HML32126.1 hypothetical protein [Sporomusa sphaeroides]
MQEEETKIKEYLGKIRAGIIIFAVCLWYQTSISKLALFPVVLLAVSLLLATWAMRGESWLYLLTASLIQSLTFVVLSVGVAWTYWTEVQAHAAPTRKIFEIIMNTTVCVFLGALCLFVGKNKALWKFEYASITKWRKAVVILVAISLSVLPWASIAFDKSLIEFDFIPFSQFHKPLTGQLAFSPDSSKLIAFSATTMGNEISSWDVKKGEQLPPIIAPDRVSQAAFSNNGQYMAIGWRRYRNPAEQDAYLTLLDLKTNKPIELNRKEPIDNVTYIGINSVAFSNDSKYLALLIAPEPGEASQKETVNTIIEIWDTETWEMAKIIKGPVGTWGGNLTYSPDGRYLAMVGREKDNTCICIWDVSTGNLYKVLAQEKELNLHNEEVTPYGLENVIFSPDGGHIAAAVRLGQVSFIKIWDVATWKLVDILPLRYGAFENSMAYSPDGGYLAFIGENSVKVWNTRSQLLAGTLPHPEKYLTRGIAYSPDGRYIAAGGEKYIKIWDVSEYELGKVRWKNRSDE